VRQINYDNYTIRVVDSGIDQVFIPRYFLNLSDFNFRYSQAGRYGELIPRSVVFVMCEIPVNSALYLETSTCFRINGSDSEYSSNSSKTYRYVKVGKTNPLDVNDTCQIEGVGDKSHSTRSKEESNKVQTDKVISDQKSKKISN